jgi:drug/metabolite transporter (DMT)-like permease
VVGGGTTFFFCNGRLDYCQCGGGNIGSFLLQTYAQSLSNNTHGVVIMVVEPVWVALLAAAWYGESMSGQQLAGCGLILLALLISRASVLRYWLKSLC